jgi:hypothetical protein
MDSLKGEITLTGEDTYDALSAIWVLACVDDDPIITYEGLRYRLSRGPVYKLKNIVASHPELFRRNISDERFDEGKHRILRAASEDKPELLPAWIRNTKRKESWEQVIDNLGPDDVFRSQLRATGGSVQANIEQIDWGLEHIERIRTARVQARSELATKNQFWLVFVVSIVNIVVTFIAVVVTG